jgi:hypothetical protein
MRSIAADFSKLLPIFAEMNIQLAGGCGEGLPEITAKKLWFNGNEHCGHAQADLGIAWPAKHAASLRTYPDNHGNGTQQTAQQEVTGQWFAGAELQTRTCNGDCSHETFSLAEDVKVFLTVYVIKSKVSALEVLSSIAMNESATTPQSHILI